jgi:hypothetical protein
MKADNHVGFYELFILWSRCSKFRLALYNSASASMETNQRSKQGSYFELIHSIAIEARKKRKKCFFEV